MDHSQVFEEVIDPARIAALKTVIGYDRDHAPPFAHQACFWDVRADRALGADGHPQTGGLIPDMGGARRMWAGGRLRFTAPLRPGVVARKQTRCLSVQEKSGQSGRFTLVTLAHEITQAGREILSEEQDLIYRREPGRASSGPSGAQDIPDGFVERCFTATDLFRYSAITFNGHRIHYDQSYATGVEGYRGLVVHGPLLAQHLMILAEDRLGTLSGFRFRATAPLFAEETARFCWTAPKGGEMRLWVCGPDGRLCLNAQAD